MYSIHKRSWHFQRWYRQVWICLPILNDWFPSTLELSACFSSRFNAESFSGFFVFKEPKRSFLHRFLPSLYSKILAWKLTYDNLRCTNISNTPALMAFWRRSSNASFLGISYRVYSNLYDINIDIKNDTVCWEKFWAPNFLTFI